MGLHAARSLTNCVSHRFSFQLVAVPISAKSYHIGRRAGVVRLDDGVFLDGGVSSVGGKREHGVAICLGFVLLAISGASPSNCPCARVNKTLATPGAFKVQPVMYRNHRSSVGGLRISGSIYAYRHTSEWTAASPSEGGGLNRRHAMKPSLSRRLDDRRVLGFK